MEGDNAVHNVGDIRGIWIASDDNGVVEKVKEIVPNFFPNVEKSMIYWISGGVQGGPKVEQTATQTNEAVRR